MPTLASIAHTCPGDDLLLAFAEGLLEQTERTNVEQHLAGCADCSAIVGATVRGPEPEELARVGRYEVVEEIGRGGMGRVLKARDPSLARDVAIKLILPAAVSTLARDRFAREAMTLGKMRHPNVLEVFDVGECDGTPYFVMEFVEGDNLDVWSRGRSPRQILECLQDAGRGLAAAHSKRILHRDFKPSNVIVGADGRARVGDFGLAGSEVAQTSPTGGAPIGGLTNTGAVMGTLAYMAPELLEGGTATTASDQFAFCVTVHEVLCGRRPFSGPDARALAAAIRRGETSEVPPGIAIPRRARAALLRGLSPDPAARFSSMQELLHELRPRRSTASRLGVGLAGGAGLAVVAAAFALADPEGPGCSGFAQELEGIYGAQAREQIRAAFAESDLPYAEASSRSTLEGLDRYAAQWIEGTTAACNAAEQEALSGEALDLRMRCFKHTAESLGAMVELLEAPERNHIERGGELVAELPNVELCSDAEALERFSVLPANAAEAAEAESLGPVVSQAHTRILAKDYQGAWDLLQRHADALDAASYPPVRVRNLRARAQILLAQEDLEGAKAFGLRAHELAVQRRLDRDASSTASLLGEIATYSGDAQEAQRWFELAIALAGAGGFTQLQALTLSTASWSFETGGDLEHAVEAARRAVELVEGDSRVSPSMRAKLLVAYADRLLTRGGGDDGLAQLQEARKILLDVHGDTHPAVGDTERSLQVRASRRGDYEAAYQHAREALRITYAIDGERSLRAIAASGNLAVALKNVGRFEEAARTLERADALLVDWPSFAPSMRIRIRINLGGLMLALRRNDAARDALTRAKAILETREEDGEASVLIDGLLSHVELRDGNLAAARRLAAGALEVSVRIFGEDHFHTADVYSRLGHVELEAGNFETARDLLARALAVEDSAEGDRGQATFLLARATVEDPEASAEDRARAIELARTAKLALSSTPAYASVLADVETWLEVHADRSRTR